jgi:hypothetical protein
MTVDIGGTEVVVDLSSGWTTPVHRALFLSSGSTGPRTASQRQVPTECCHRVRGRHSSAPEPLPHPRRRQASPPNQHLHAYGLIALGELVELWRLTDDPYYLDRARDNLACFLQMVARADGDFNAGKGMVTERYYQSDCSQPKGSILPLSHAWSVGVLLHASQVALADPDAFPAGLDFADAGKEMLEV